METKIWVICRGKKYYIGVKKDGNTTIPEWGPIEYAVKFYNLDYATNIIRLFGAGESLRW